LGDLTHACPVLFFPWASVFLLFATDISRYGLSLTLRRNEEVDALMRIAVTPWCMTAD